MINYAENYLVYLLKNQVSFPVKKEKVKWLKVLSLVSDSLGLNPGSTTYWPWDLGHMI